MAAADLVLVQGIRDTRATLDAWGRQPWRAVRVWVLGAVAVSVALLLATWIVALLSTPDPTPELYPAAQRDGSLADVGTVLYKNSLVLALHAMACVAGFIAGSSLPMEAQRYSGLWRRIHDHAGPLAILFVIGATTFSLATQAYALGGSVSTLAHQFGIPNATFLVGLLPHALPELTALFLPLAAWTVASRRGEWHHLLAATFVTVAIAVPVLVASAFVEVFVSPHIVLALAGH